MVPSSSPSICQARPWTQRSMLSPHAAHPYIAGAADLRMPATALIISPVRAESKAPSPPRREPSLHTESDGPDEGPLGPDSYRTLHVGLGTFLPVKAEDTADHRMHAEWGEVTAQVAADLNALKRTGAASSPCSADPRALCDRDGGGGGTIAPYRGETDIFITPDYRFRPWIS